MRLTTGPRPGTDAYQIAWENERLDLIPEQWQKQFRSKFQRMKIDGAPDRAANLWLLAETTSFQDVKLPLNATDADLCAIAHRCAANCMSLATVATSVDSLRERQSAYVSSWGITPPGAFDIATQTGTEDRPAIARMTDQLWWRRGIRRVHARLLEGHAIRLGFVHRHASIYCSAETLTRRTQQRKRNALALERTIATNEFGDEYTLAELAARSVANPAIRRGELMTRIAGFEAIAKGLGHVAEFVTITCPSRMHPRLSESGKENPRHDGTTPKAAHQYLGKVWSQVRAKLARIGIRLYGFRIAEPHHDGCPHWHMIFFMPAALRPSTATVPRFRAVLRRYFLLDSTTELGAKRNRVRFIAIDPARGSAAGYVAKYVAKNIDGYGLNEDLLGTPALEASARVDAWSSTWGIRQFQPVGGPPVGLWRELRRMKATAVEMHEPGFWIEQAREAADAGNWRRYVEVMGGPTIKRTGRPVALAYGPAETIDQSTGEILQAFGRYGDAITRKITGIWEVVTGRVIKIIRYVWTFTSGFLGRLLTPRTCVNNCTQQEEEDGIADRKHTPIVGRGASGTPHNPGIRVKNGHPLDRLPIQHPQQGHPFEAHAPVYGTA